MKTLVKVLAFTTVAVLGSFNVSFADDAGKQAGLTIIPVEPHVVNKNQNQNMHVTSDNKIGNAIKDTHTNVDASKNLGSRNDNGNGIQGNEGHTVAGNHIDANSGIQAHVLAANVHTNSNAGTQTQVGQVNTGTQVGEVHVGDVNAGTQMQVGRVNTGTQVGEVHVGDVNASKNTDTQNVTVGNRSNAMIGSNVNQSGSGLSSVFGSNTANNSGN